MKRAQSNLTSFHKNFTTSTFFHEPGLYIYLTFNEIMGWDLILSFGRDSIVKEMDIIFQNVLKILKVSIYLATD